MPRWPERGWLSVFRGLPFRVTAFLALALLPLGYLSVSQTQVLAETTERQTQANLIRNTETILADATRQLTLSIGAARALSSVIGQTGQNLATCAETLRDFQMQNRRYQFAGVMDPSGIVLCAAGTKPPDLAKSVQFVATTADQRLAIVKTADPTGRNDTDLTILSPMATRTQGFVGFVILTLSIGDLLAFSASDNTVQPLRLDLRTPDGDLLISVGQVSLGELPLGSEPLESRVASRNPTASSAQFIAQSGQHIVSVPMIPNLIDAVAVWPETPETGRLATASTVPVLMWLASLSVAYLAVHRLVVQHIQRLGRQMREFGQNRVLPKLHTEASIPADIRTLEATFRSMALDLVSEEARMEDALREKNILLKEVHHRVKNNLQLISSIMNLQVRSTQNAEIKSIVRRLQERVRGLATVYGHMYQNHGAERTSSADLLNDVFGQILNPDVLPTARLKVSQHFEDVGLTPDQAIPLALVSSELASNALKTILKSPDHPHKINVGFTVNNQNQAHLHCSNTFIGKGDDTGKAGLGTRLVHALSQQLDAETETRSEAGCYRVDVRFRLEQDAIQDRVY